MKKEDFIARYRQEMADVQVSPQLKRRTLEAIQGKESVLMRKKIPVALAALLVILMIGAVALAAVSRVGILDFAGRYVGAYVPEDAGDYVQTDVRTMENDLVTVTLSELYYDGYVARMTMEVVPKDEGLLLIGTDISPDDYWQNMLFLNNGWDEKDERTVLDVFREGGYRMVYGVSTQLIAGDEPHDGTSDYVLGGEGGITLYHQTIFDSPLTQREGTLRVCLTPRGKPYTDHEYRWPEDRIVLEMPLTIQQAEYANETYVSAGGADFANAGVRVDEIRLEVRAQEIHATIDYTVTDREAFDALEDGLWFEFIDPNSTAQEPWQQCLQGGMTGCGAVGPADGKDLQSAVHLRQTLTLGRNELHKTYTLRAFSAWDKERLEAHTFVMTKAE